MESIFEFAINMEKEGAKYYENLAAKAPHRGLSRILQVLAEEEREHIDVVRALMEQSSLHPRFRSTAEAKSVFKQLAAEGAVPFSGDEDTRMQYAQTYNYAWEAEKRSYDLYRKAAEDADSLEARDILLELAEQERQHMILVNILFKSAAQPQGWMESDEFHRLEEIE